MTNLFLMVLISSISPKIIVIGEIPSKDIDTFLNSTMYLTNQKVMKILLAPTRLATATIDPGIFREDINYFTTCSDVVYRNIQSTKQCTI